MINIDYFTNIKALRVAYETFFYQTEELTDAELIKNHIKLIDTPYSKYYDDEWIRSTISNYKIRNSFKDVSTYSIVESIIEIFGNIISTYGLDSEYEPLIINKLEAAATLANNAVASEMLDRNENHLYTDDNGDTYYNEDAQNLFNEFYDYYLLELENLNKG